jgi:hypothetical protein
LSRFRFILLFLAIFVVSCQNDEAPQNFLSGTYETIQEIQGRESWYVNQLRFQADGTFEQTSYLKESEFGDRIGFTYFSRGNYTLNGIDFSLIETHIKDTGFDEALVPVLNLEDLSERELLPEGLESRGILSLLNQGDSFTLRMGCIPEIGICSMLNRTLTFNKID